MNVNELFQRWEATVVTGSLVLFNETEWFGGEGIVVIVEVMLVLHKVDTDEIVVGWLDPSLSIVDVLEDKPSELRVLANVDDSMVSYTNHESTVESYFY